MVVVDPLTGAMWTLPNEVKVDFNPPGDSLEKREGRLLTGGPVKRALPFAWLGGKQPGSCRTTSICLPSKARAIIIISLRPGHRGFQFPIRNFELEGDGASMSGHSGPFREELSHELNQSPWLYSAHYRRHNSRVRDRYWTNFRSR